MQSNEICQNERTNQNNPSNDKKESREEPQNELKSGEFLLSVIQTEYTNESERVKSLETRTGIFLVFAGALLSFLSGTLKLPNLYYVKVNNALEATSYVLVWVFAICTLISLFSAIVYFVRVVSVQTYKRLSLDGFERENAVHDKEIVAVAIMHEYKIVIENNHEINNMKIIRFKIGIYLIIISLIFTVITYMFSTIINR